MDADRFDLLARSLSTLSRRGLSRALAGLGLGGGLRAVWGAPSTDAKRKKKKCKKSQKKCAKKCIPKTNCCNILDCGHAAGCVNGRCECLEDFRSCGGKCILDDQFSCCNDAECGIIEGFEYDVCVDNSCECSGFHCDGPQCCAAGEVCNNNTQHCEPGPCPPNQFCNLNDSIYKCGPDCVCTTSVNGGPWCVDMETVDCTTNCTSDAQCGAGRVCVSRNTSIPCSLCNSLADGFCMSFGNCSND